MTTREKIIVGLMCLAIIYGAWEVLGNRTGNPAPAISKEDPVKQARSLISDLSKKVISEKIPEGYNQIIELADESWTKDPFLMQNQALTAEKEVEKPVEPDKVAALPPTFNYTGYLQVGDARLAIINGQEYAVGDSIHVDNYYVKRIAPQIVVLAKTDGSETLEIPLQEAFPK